MKKHLSVLALCAGETFARVLALLAAMGVLESVLFALHWLRRDPAQPMITAEDMLPGIPLICALGFLFSVILLLDGGGEGGSAAGYTLQRLRICEEAVVLWKAAYNSLCLLLFWAVQTAVAIGLYSWYTAAIGPAYSSAQTVFLAFYRIPFLHNLLPLDNWTRYLRNIALILAMGYCIAARGYKLRRDSRYGWGLIIFLWGTAVFSFRMEITVWPVDLAVILVSLMVLIVDAEYMVKEWRRGRNEAEKN